MAKILVIEDEVPLLEEILEWLTFEGYESYGATNGIDGVELALQKTPDLIVSDISMAGMDGYRVFLELRTYETVNQVPFMFVTARASRADIRVGMELGVDDYITKPFSRAELLTAVRTQLAKQSERHAQIEGRLDHMRRMISRTLPHELRTPLVSILGFAELMEMDAHSLDGDRIADMSRRILNNGKRLFRLIENYILYTQLDVLRNKSESVNGVHARFGRCATHPSYSITQTAYDTAAAYARTDDLQLNFVDAPVAIDDANLKKVCQELIDNAFKFSEPGSPVIVQGLVNGTEYVIHIEDSGRGIAAEHLKEIGAYMQFDREIYEQQGSGLGLVLVRLLTELFAGALVVESTPNEGTSCTVRLPLCE